MTITHLTFLYGFSLMTTFHRALREQTRKSLFTQTCYIVENKIQEVDNAGKFPGVKYYDSSLYRVIFH